MQDRPANAKSAESSEKYSKARIELEAAVKLGDKSNRTIATLSNVRVKTGDLDGAIEMLNQVISTQPDNIDLKMARAELSLRKTIFPLPLVTYKKFTRASPRPKSRQLWLKPFQKQTSVTMRQPCWRTI